MESLLGWVLGNLGWESLKRLLSGRRVTEIRLLRRALEDAQNANRELIADRALMTSLVEQRNRAMAKLLETERRVTELEAECVPLRDAIG